MQIQNKEKKFKSFIDYEVDIDSDDESDLGE